MTQTSRRPPGQVAAATRPACPHPGISPGVFGKVFTARAALSVLAGFPICGDGLISHQAVAAPFEIADAARPRATRAAIPAAFDELRQAALVANNPEGDPAEAAIRADTARAELAARTDDRRRLLVAGLVAALVAASLSLLAVLYRNTRELRSARRALYVTRSRPREATDGARDAGETKARFIAAADRGISASPGGVTGFVDRLPETQLEPSLPDLARRLRDANGTVTRVFDDIDSELRSGRFAREPKPFSPDAVTAAAAIGIEAQARAKGLTIVAIPSPGLPRYLQGDAGGIGQVLFTLASNAVKFTDKGGISLQVLCTERRGGRATIEWIVSDTGRGIDPDRIANLFKASAAAGETNADGPAGVGFGLAICERLVARMGGGIFVESTPGEGARFRVRLSFDLTPGGVANAKPVAPSAAPLRACLRRMGRRPLVMIAEDTPGGQFILRQMLAGEGIAPRVVADGRAAVIAAEAEHYDVICMDLRMPELDGLEATRRIRSGLGPSARTPIIAVTASGSPEDAEACRDAGMTLFVAKPVSRERLLNAILTVLTVPPPRPSIADQRSAA